VLFADSFEQGEWNGQWVEDSQNDWFRSTHRAFDGSYAAEVDGRATDATLTMANPLDLTSYGSAEITFSSFIERNWDSGEYIALDLFDGSSWNEVSALRGNVDQENVWHQETVTIDSNYLVSDFKARFRANVSSSNEDGHVDDVQIVGTPTGSELAINDVQLTEGDSGSSNLVFTVTRSGDTAGISSVNFDTADGTANAGADYVATSGTVQFLEYETSQMITVPVNGDTEFEPDETFFVNLSNPDNATLTDAQGQGLIVNDDSPPPTISIGDVTLLEGGSIDAFVSAGSGGLNSPRGMVMGSDGNLYIASTDNDAVLRYDGTSGVFIDVFVPTGGGGLNHPIDLVFGPDNALYVSSADSDSVLRYDGSTGTFIDAFVSAGTSSLDRPSDLLFGGPDGNLYVSSGNSGEILRYNATSGAFMGAFVSAGSGGLISPRGLLFRDGLLYVADFNGHKVLRYDETSGAFVDEFVSYRSGGLDSPDAIIFGPDGNLYVSGDNGDNVLRYNGATGSFLDAVIAAGAGGLNGPRDLIFDSGGNLMVASRFSNEVLRLQTGLTVSLSVPSAVPITVDFGTADGTALATADYTAISGTLSFAPGQTTAKIFVSTIDDVVSESNEAFVMNLGNPSGAYTISDGQGAATIGKGDQIYTDGKHATVDTVTVR
jgi:hypothetical protein